MTRAIVIGASTAGKTTILKHLKVHSDLPIDEADDVLTRLNAGTYPLDEEYKMNVLVPQMVNDVLERDAVVFFTNTAYFQPQDLEKAREAEFRIIQLALHREEMKRRNRHRIEHESYDDLSKYFEGMLVYQKDIKERGLVDKEINTDQPVENVAKELLEFIE